MGFFEWIDDVKRSYRFSKQCDSAFLNKYTYSQAGVLYARRDIYFRPYFEIDEFNNVVEITKPQGRLEEWSWSIGPAPFPLQNKYYPHFLQFDRIGKGYEYYCYTGKSQHYKLTEINVTDKCNYVFFNYEDTLRNISDIKWKDEGYNGVCYYLKEYHKYDMPLVNLNLDKVLWHQPYLHHYLFTVHSSFLRDKKTPRLNSVPGKLFKSNSLMSVIEFQKNEERKRYLWLFDFETTGLNPEENEILEIGLKIYEINDLKISRVEEDGPEYITIPVKFGCFRKVIVPQEIQDLTNITQGMVDKEGIDDKLIVEKFKYLYEKYGKNAIFSSYNLYFDASFFLGFCEKNNLKFDFDWLDILTVARDRYSYPHKLGDILDKYVNGRFRWQQERKNLALKAKNSHRALDDVDAAYLIFLFMLEDFDDIGKYIGIIGHPKNHPFKVNKYILPYINNGKGRKKGKINTRVQFFKNEYPLYFNCVHDMTLYQMQHEYMDDEIVDDFDDLDFKMNIPRE